MVLRARGEVLISWKARQAWKSCVFFERLTHSIIMSQINTLTVIITPPLPIYTIPSSSYPKLSLNFTITWFGENMGCCLRSELGLWVPKLGCLHYAFNGSKIGGLHGKLTMAHVWRTCLMVSGVVWCKGPHFTYMLMTPCSACKAVYTKWPSKWVLFILCSVRVGMTNACKETDGVLYTRSMKKRKKRMNH